MKRLEAFCEEAASLLLTAYLFIMFCMFPFYLRNGYLEVGKEKYHFYKAVTVGGFGLIIPLVFVCMVCHSMNRKPHIPAVFPCKSHLFIFRTKIG